MGSPITILSWNLVTALCIIIQCKNTGKSWQDENKPMNWVLHLTDLSCQDFSIRYHTVPWPDRTRKAEIMESLLPMTLTWIREYLPQLRSKTHLQFLFHLVIGVIRILFSDVLSF